MMAVYLDLVIEVLQSRSSSGLIEYNYVWVEKQGNTAVYASPIFNDLSNALFWHHCLVKEITSCMSKLADM